MSATELATAYVSLVPSMGGAQGKIAQELASVDMDGVGKSMGGKMGGGIMGSLKSFVGPIAALFAADAIKDFAVKSVDSFSELEDSTAAAGVVFGDNMSSIIDQSKTAASTLGLSSQQVINAANTYGTYGKAAGLSGQALADFSSKQTALAADMASFKGTSPEQAIEAIGAALRGETEPIRAYGVMLDDASMRQEALSMGLVSTTKDALTPQNKILAAQSLIMKQTTDAQGDYARTSKSTANVAKTLAAETENLSAKIGGVLAPAFTAVRLVGIDAVRYISASVDTLAPKITDVVGRIGVAWGGLKDLFLNADITPALLHALGLEEDSPIIGGLFWLQDKVWAVIRGINDFMFGIKIPTDILNAAGVDMSGLTGIGAAVRDVFMGIVDAIGPLIPHVVDLYSALSPVQLIFQAIQPFIPPLLAMFGQLASVIGGTLITAIEGILPAVLQLQTIFVDLLQGVIVAVLPTVVQLVTMLGQTFAQLLPILVPIITTVMGLAATLVTQLAPIFMQLVTAVLPMVVSIFGSLLSAIGPLVSTIAGVLIPIISALMPVVVTVFGVIADVITNAMQIVQGIIQVVTGIISGNWAQVWSGILNILSGAFGLILSLVSGGFNFLVSLVGAALNIVVSVFTGAWAGIINYLGTAWSSIVNGAAGMGQDLLNFFGGLGGKIMGALGNIGSTLFNTGKNIIQGLIDGIGSMMGAIGRAVINIVPEAIRGPFEDLLGIHSPSRVFRAYGVNIGQGLVLGIEDMYDPVAEATAALAWVPDTPSFATTGAQASYAAAAVPGDTGSRGPLIQQDIHPAEKMSEENLANIAARKVIGALT